MFIFCDDKDNYFDDSDELFYTQNKVAIYKISIESLIF